MEAYQSIGAYSDANPVFCAKFYKNWNVWVTSTLVILGTIGNVICIVIFHLYPWLGGSLIGLLLALAWADTLHTFLNSLVIVWPDVAMYCCGGQKIWNFVMYSYAYLWPIVGMALSLSVWFVVLITLHRYIAVIHPLKHSVYSTRKVIRRHIILICILCILFELPRFFEIEVIEIMDPSTNQTIKFWTYTDLFNDQYYQLIYKNIIMLPMKKYIPIFIISYASIRIVLAVKKRNKIQNAESTTEPPTQSSSKNAKQEVKVTQTMLIIMIAFIVTQLPTCAYPIARLILPDEKKVSCSVFAIYAVVADTFALTNTCINFYIYVIAWRAFRSRVMLLFCGKCCGKQFVREHETSTVYQHTTQHSLSHR